MSTTWVFLGLLAGREIGIALRLRHRGKKKVNNLVFSDAGKAFFGSAVAIVLAMFLPLLAGRAVESKPESAPAESIVESVVESAIDVVEPTIESAGDAADLVEAPNKE